MPTMRSRHQRRLIALALLVASLTMIVAGLFVVRSIWQPAPVTKQGAMAFLVGKQNVVIVCQMTAVRPLTGGVWSTPLDRSQPCEFLSVPGELQATIVQPAALAGITFRAAWEFTLPNFKPQVGDEVELEFDASRFMAKVRSCDEPSLFEDSSTPLLVFNEEVRLPHFN